MNLTEPPAPPVNFELIAKGSTKASAVYCLGDSTYMAVSRDRSAWLMTEVGTTRLFPKDLVV